MKRTSWFPFILAVVPILFFTSAVFAQDNLKNQYVVVKGGMYSPQNDDVKDFEDGINLEVAFGTYMNKYFGAELGIGFFQTKFTENSGKVTTKFFPITFNLLGNYPSGPVEIYGGGGVGAYISKTEITITGNSDSEVDTFYGFQVLVGGRYNMANNLFIGIEGKYIWTKTPEQEFFGIKVTDTHYDGIVGTLNIGTRF